MWVFVLSILLSSDYQANQSLSFLKNNIKLNELEIDINCIKYPKSSLKCMKKIKKEYYTEEKFTQEAEQNLINIKNEEKKCNRLEKNINNLKLMAIA